MGEDAMSPKTLAEKILSEHAGRDLRAGDFAICKVDFTFGQDGTSSIIIDRVREMGIKKLKTKFCMVIDHSAPSPSEGVSRVHKKMRVFGTEFKQPVFDIGCGVCHQVIPESGWILPGDLVLGADSHTCTYGALGVFSTGVGSTDLAVTLAAGKNWFKVPETLKVVLNGKLPRGVYAKDAVLYIIGRIKADGATYNALEFCGSAIDSMDMDGRMTISNMAVEMGAKAGLMPVDAVTVAWLKARGIPASRIRRLAPDKGARYARVLEYDVSRLEPQVSLPHSVDSAVPVGKVKGVKIQEAFIGTCTNGRLSDLRAAAAVLKKRSAAPGVRLIVAPASRDIYLRALKEGIIGDLVSAGAAVVVAGCGPCVGTHNGIPADGEKVISTANRNFKGRMGNPNAFIYLGSPALAAASALEGRIADPRKYL